jgi:hypothetical protein
LGLATFGPRNFWALHNSLIGWLVFWSCFFVLALLFLLALLFVDNRLDIKKKRAPSQSSNTKQHFVRFIELKKKTGGKSKGCSVQCNVHFIMRAALEQST